METQSRIQQRHTMPNSNRSIGFTLVLAVVTLALAACIPCSAAFNLQMEYKPPVKSSVGKLHDRRFSRDSSNPAKADSPSRSSSSKSAYAAGATYYQPEAPPAGVDSFERRMRDMVLGNQQQKRETTTTRKPPSRRLPPNVQVVESLQQYKTVVADEKERVVAVRFYAPWCKVRLDDAELIVWCMYSSRFLKTYTHTHSLCLSPSINL